MSSSNIIFSSLLRQQGLAKHGHKPKAAGEEKEGEVTMKADQSALWAAVVSGFCLVSMPNTAAKAIPYVAPPYICVTNYYVDPNGKDSNPGSSGAPWRTLSGAINKLAGSQRPGVCVNVNPGTYTESLYIGSNLSGGWDGPHGYLVFRSSTLHAAQLKEPYANINSTHTATIQNTRYVIFDGFTVSGYTVPYAGASGLFTQQSNHVKFLNNIVHDIGGGGIVAVQSDYIYVQGNVVYNTSCCYVHGSSGIDFYAPVASDYNSGFHNVISSNISYHNSEGTDGRYPHTEGHGIILDNFRLNGYTASTLIENNLVYNNGGTGIDLYDTNHATIRNNTAYNNLRDSLEWGGGDLFVFNSSNVISANNIAELDGSSSLLSLWDQTTDGTNYGNVWSHNLTYNSYTGQLSVTRNITSVTGNILGRNPLFMNPGAANFNLQASSPASGTGTAAYGVPKFDLAGNVRSTSIIDMGAFATHY